MEVLKNHSLHLSKEKTRSPLQHFKNKVIIFDKPSRGAQGEKKNVSISAGNSRTTLKNVALNRLSKFHTKKFLKLKIEGEGKIAKEF